MSGRASPDQVLCAGRLYCDLIFTGVPRLPSMGAEVFADNLSLHAGGGAFITAAAFDALGMSASLLSTLPAAPFDAVACAQISAENVDISRCVPAETGASPQITVAISGGDDRAFLSHKSGVAIPSLTSMDGAWRHLHIGELRTLVEHPELIDLARDAGLSISLDCGWDEELLASGADMERLINLVDIFLPNDGEFDRLCASGMSETAAPLCVVKCGAKGARARAGDGVWVESAPKPVKVLDATGAGDAFNGGFLFAWLSGSSIEANLSLGNLCGATSVQHVGGTGGFSKLRTRFAKTRADAAE